jgi:hypothetical protein
MFVPLPFFVLGTAVCLLIAIAIWSYSSSLKINTQNWHDLVSQLHQLNRDGVTLLAREFLQPHPDQIAIEPEKMWEMIGGYPALKEMAENARILLSLAGYAQQWNFEEGVIVAERMRRDALAVRRAVHRIALRRAASLLLPRRLRVLDAFDLHEAVSSYHLMCQRLLALYQTSHAGLYPALAEIL